MAGLIEFRRVVKSFGSKEVLADLSFAIEAGKITFIVGKSGEGKSVTIKHIIGLLQPDSGEIMVGGKSILNLDRKETNLHRRRFGMLFQHAALFDSLSVMENIIFPLSEQSQVSKNECIERAYAVLKQVGLPDITDKYPSALSTGEKKRVGLARALITQPEILLYDEPTTGMDPLVCEMIDALIVKVNQDRAGITSVVISHDLKAALDTADEIIMLYKGRLALKGSPLAFRNSGNPIVRQFFTGQVEGPMEFL